MKPSRREGAVSYVGDIPPYERPQRPFRTPIQHNYEYLVAVEPQKPPGPFDWTENQPRRAKHRRYTVLARREWRAVRKSELLGNKLTLIHRMNPPQGRQPPFKLRANIERNPPSSYGNRFVVKPQQGNVDSLMALMGM